MDVPVLYWVFMAIFLVAPVVAILVHWKGFWAEVIDTVRWGLSHSGAKWSAFVIVCMVVGVFGMLVVSLSQLPAD